MKNTLHICSIKKPCRMQVVFGLCLAMLFTFILPSFKSYADEVVIDGLYPLKTSNILGYNANNRIDQGFSSAQMSYAELDSSYTTDYYTYVFDQVDNALMSAQGYFSFPLNYTFNKNLYIQYFKNYDNQLTFLRDYFLNVYLCVNKDGTAYIYCQNNKGYGGFSDSTYTIESRGSDNYIKYNLSNSITFWNPVIDNSDEFIGDYISVPDVYIPGTNTINTNNFIFYPLALSNTSSFTHGSITFPNYHTSYSNDTFTNVYYGVIKNWFFIPKLSGSIETYFSLNFDYILPLYIDSNIYTTTSFYVPVTDASTLSTTLVNWNNNYFLTYSPNLDLNSYSQYFAGQYWYTNKFASGILKYSVNPDPIITPIPTFGPIYSPTPFPTLNIKATLTPIAIPNDPLISTGLGDPISVVYGIIGYLTQVLSLPHIKFISTTIEYIYNSNIFFQILMFLVPGIVLLTFMIGRLKRK